jgi:hypothetical protein
MDHEKFQSLVQGIYSIVGELGEMFPGRHFTPDGHMVGSLGECLVADAYGLELMPSSNEGYDAVTSAGKKVEIKATQAKSVSFRSCPEHTIIIKINPDGTFDECYNGPGEIIWKQFEGRKLPSNGQYQISINRVKALSETVAVSSRVERLK